MEDRLIVTAEMLEKWRADPVTKAILGQYSDRSMRKLGSLHSHIVEQATSWSGNCELDPGLLNKASYNRGVVGAVLDLIQVSHESLVEQRLLEAEA